MPPLSGNFYFFMFGIYNNSPRSQLTNRMYKYSSSIQIVADIPSGISCQVSQSEFVINHFIQRIFCLVKTWVIFSLLGLSQTTREYIVGIITDYQENSARKIKCV